MAKKRKERKGRKVTDEAVQLAAEQLARLFLRQVMDNRKKKEHEETESQSEGKQGLVI